MAERRENGRQILIVGFCAAGKSTLARGLQALGYQARAFSQEHSHSPRVWQRRNPDILVFLHCEYETIKRRRDVSWGFDGYRRQQRRLAHARSHAQLVVATDELQPNELVSQVAAYLEMREVPGSN